jgi:hypothetical protein
MDSKIDVKLMILLIVTTVMVGSIILIYKQIQPTQHNFKIGFCYEYTSPNPFTSQRQEIKILNIKNNYIQFQYNDKFGLISSGHITLYNDWKECQCSE